MNLSPLYSDRASGIRTHDPLHPMQVRYQTALQPESFALFDEDEGKYTEAR